MDKNMLEILGVKINSLTQNEVLQRVESFLEDGNQHYIVTPNPEFLVKAQKDREFMDILNRADLAVPDGIGLIFASWFFGKRLKKRITGVDLMEAICEKASQKKWQVFLFGTKKAVDKKTAENLKQKYFGLDINCFDESYFKKRLSVQPAIIFVALGSGAQERWIVNNIKKIPCIKLAMGVGGSFDFISGQILRAPKVLRVIGLEWFWRLCCEPKRIFRIFNAVIKFPLLILKYRIKV